MLRLTHLAKKCASLEMASVLANRTRAANSFIRPVPQMAFMATKRDKTVKGVEPQIQDIDRTTENKGTEATTKNSPEDIIAKDDRDFEPSKSNKSWETPEYASKQTARPQETSDESNKDSHERTATEYIKDAAEKVKDATINAGHKVWETAEKAASVATNLAFDATESVVKSIREGDEVVMSSFKPERARSDEKSEVIKTQAKEAAQKMSKDEQSREPSEELEEEKYGKIRDNLFDYLSEKTVEKQETKSDDKKAASEASQREKDKPNTKMAEEKEIGEIAKTSAEKATSKSSQPNVSIGLKDSSGTYAGYGNSSGSAEGSAPTGYESTGKTPPNYVGVKPSKMAENPSMKESDIPPYGYATEDWVEDEDKATAPIKNIKSGFETEREAMSSLVARGFTEKFQLGEKKVTSSRLGKSFDLNHVSIMEVHGFQGEKGQDPAKNRIYMAIEATSSEDGHSFVYKGIIETNYSKLRSPEVQSLVEKATDKREGVEKAV